MCFQVEPGDLDPKVSRHYVTTLKAAYLQLKWFVAAGCTFVGHGLKKVRDNPPYSWSFVC